jgi:hypothetical protein
MSISMKYTDIIQQYDGSSDFMVWVEKLELVAKLQNVNELSRFLPLFLSGGAFKVYQGLLEDDKSDYIKVKNSLKRAFSVDSFKAYEELMCRKIQNGETVDVYLADLKRLSRLISDPLNDEFLKCAFVMGLNDDIRKQIRAACSMDMLCLEEIVERVRSLMKSSDYNHCMAGIKNSNFPHKNQQQRSVVTCFKCGVVGHISRNCTQMDRFRSQNERKCYLCGSVEHIVSGCPKRYNVSKN